jgi:hypothetical protein
LWNWIAGSEARTLDLAGHPFFISGNGRLSWASGTSSLRRLVPDARLGFGLPTNPPIGQPLADDAGDSRKKKLRSGIMKLTIDIRDILVDHMAAAKQMKTDDLEDGLMDLFTRLNKRPDPT